MKKSSTNDGTKGLERRDFPRVSASCGVKYRKVDGEGVEAAREDGSSAVMNNISGGGISFSSAEELEAGQMLALEVALPGFPSDVISMGRVCWVDPSEERAGHWDVGVEFWWIGWKDEGAQQQVRSFITDSLREA